MFLGIDKLIKTNLHQLVDELHFLSVLLVESLKCLPVLSFLRRYIYSVSANLSYSWSLPLLIKLKYSSPSSGKFARVVSIPCLLHRSSCGPLRPPFSLDRPMLQAPIVSRSRNSVTPNTKKVICIFNSSWNPRLGNPCPVTNSKACSMFSSVKLRITQGFHPCLDRTNLLQSPKY